MTISAETKIGVIIKDNQQAIDALIAISPHFKKLKNPLLRKILAPRVTVAEAAIIGNCKVQAILDNLAQIGFNVEYTQHDSPGTLPRVPAFQNHAEPVKSIDVRADLFNGIDPFNTIMSELSAVPADKTMLVINSFEPAPLIRILRGKGYEVVVSKKDPGVVLTYITKNDKTLTPPAEETGAVANPELFDSILKHYCLKFTEVDVRQMEMPMPMIAILDELDKLEKGEALYVRHKKIPLFLLPELKDRNFKYVYKQAETEVVLIIYHSHE